MKEVCVFAPATIANLNVGFDVLGLALNTLGDKVHLKINNRSENKIIEIVNGSEIPLDLEKNCCSVVIKTMQKHTQQFIGVDIKIKKGFETGSGLGSSSASSAAAAYAYNLILGSPFTKEELIAFAAEGERIACGAPHLDNVAPCLLGGLVMLHESAPLSLPLPKGLFLLSFFPKIKVHTKDARAILDQKVPVNLMKSQIGHMAAFIKSLYSNNLNLFSKSLKDLIVEPKRKLLIPKFDELKQTALKEGALAFGISGSGPSVFAICKNQKTCETIQQNMLNLYKETGIQVFCHLEELKVSSGTYICNYNN